MTDVHDWSELRYFEVAKFGNSFFFPEEPRKKTMLKVQTENDHHEPHVWVFSIVVRGASESKGEISKGSGLV